MYNYYQMYETDMYYSARRQLFLGLIIFMSGYGLLLNFLYGIKFFGIVVSIYWTLVNFGVTHFWVKRQMRIYQEYLKTEIT